MDVGCLGAVFVCCVEGFNNGSQAAWQGDNRVLEGPARSVVFTRRAAIGAIALSASAP